jgi:hypothetical protein
MARFTAQVESSAALAVDTGFAWLMGNAAGNGKLRRVTIGVRAGGGVPTSMQCVVGVNRVTTAGTTPAAGTISKMDKDSIAATLLFNTGYATPPTLAAADLYRIPFNSQSTGDLPYELLEELMVANATTDGLCFINRDNALPASHQYVLTVEFEQ